MAGPMKLCCVLVLFYFMLCIVIRSVAGKGMLFPRDSESREIRGLDGIWDFRADMSPTRNEGFQNKWFNAPLSKSGPVIPMAVPSSYNDVGVDASLRDFVGWVWYDREFYVSRDWATKRVVLRVESAHYYAVVWVNGEEVTMHNGGHLPFEVDVNNVIHFDGVNRVTIAVNNTLTPTTLPPGKIIYKNDTNKYPKGYFVQQLQMDFFNYAGLHRHVRLYSTPTTYIDDITIVTSFKDTTGIVKYIVISEGKPSTISARVDIIDASNKVQASSTKLEDTLQVSDVNLWWPYTMTTKTPAYRYTLKVTLKSENATDIYRLPFGIRTVNFTTTQLLINKQPFYCHGVDKHEDSDIRGKGLDYALIVRDFNLMKWLGANCFRTSHYPYAEEILDQADQQGFVVIDECPGVGIERENLGNVSLAHHLEVMMEFVRRDKNRPSVMAWSVANEPQSYYPEAKEYFRTVINYTRHLDPTRMVTFVMDSLYSNEQAGEFVDFMCVNRYYGWYSDTGVSEVIPLQLGYDFHQWNKRFNKPMIISEYGAGSVIGQHTLPSVDFSEEYQVDVFRESHKEFDKLMKEFLVGELVWNFADFMTVQGVTRVVGNRKGIFTRQRQPKMVAFLLRERYQSLINNTLYGRH